MTTTGRGGDACAHAADRIEIAERSPAHPDASHLLHAFHREQVSRYGFADPIELDSREYAAPNGVFVVAYYSAAAAGCGGYRWFDRASHTIEIKKTYVVATSRGAGAGRAILTWLERHAVAAGARRAVLETGVRNTAALRLFASAGYLPTGAYVDNRDPAINRAFTKTLTSPARPPGDCLLQASAR